MIEIYYVLKESISKRYIKDFYQGELDTTAEIDDAAAFSTVKEIAEFFDFKETNAFFSEHNANWEAIKMMGVTR